VNSETVNRRARIAFGLVLLLALFAGAGWMLLTSSQYRPYRIYTSDAVSGLTVDSPVEFHGVEVGKVKDVELLGPRSIRVSLSILKTTPIDASTVATITSRGLATRGFTGYVYVALDNTGTNSKAATAPPGEPYAVIATAPSRIMSLDTTLNQIDGNVQALTGLIQGVLDTQTTASLKHSVESLEQVSRTLADNDRKLNAIIANTEQASRRLKPLLDSGDRLTGAIRTQIFPQAYHTLSNLDRLSGSLAGAADKVRQDPSVVIRGAAQPSPGPGERRP
jgi:phospholipid/cholesterol/gamma-HCH transport system substrate-binding protein